MINKSPSIVTAWFSAFITGYVANNGTVYPTTWTVSINTANWATNPTTQSAAIPFVTIPSGWQFMTGCQIAWSAGVPALTTTTVQIQPRDIVNNSGGGIAAILNNPQMAASQPVSVAQAGPFSRNLLGVPFNQLSVRIVNTDANAITCNLGLTIRAFKIV